MKPAAPGLLAGVATLILGGLALGAALAGAALLAAPLAGEGDGPLAEAARRLLGAEAWLTADHAPPGQLALATLAAALGAGLGARAAREGAIRFGLLLALLVTGLAATCWLTEPRWFPALRLRPKSPADLAMMAALAAEGAAALLVLLLRPGLRAGLARLGAGFGGVRAGWGRLLLLAALLCLLSVSPMDFIRQGDPAGYVLRLAAGSVVVLVHLAALAALAGLPVAPAFAERGLRLSLPALALLATLAAALTGAFGFGHVPHVEDEVAYLFQARLFAEGALAAPAPPDAAAFDYYLLTISPATDAPDGRWFAAVPPGWPAALAPFVWAGVPHLLNPLLTGLAVLLLHAFVRRATGDRILADRSALLLALSPWAAGLGGPLMPHAFSLALLLAGWLLLLRAREASPAPAAGQALVAGLAFGWLFLARPLEGVLAGGLTGLWMLAAFRLPGWRAILAYGAGCLLTGWLVFPFNAALTGDPFLPPLTQHLEALWGPGANAFGFGAAIGPKGGWAALDLRPGHGPLEALVNTANGLRILNLDLFGWGAGSLLLLLALALFGLAPARTGRAGAERALAAFALAVIAVQALYWFTDAFYIGTRYWYAAMPAFVLLSAAGAETLSARLAAAGATRAARRIWPGVTLLALLGLLVFLPWRGAAKYRDYGNYTTLVPRLAAAGAFDAPPGTAPGSPAPLVLLNITEDLGPAFALNDPWLRPEHPVFARDPGPEARAALSARFPGRPVILFTD